MSVDRKRPKKYRKAWSGGSREAAMAEADAREAAQQTRWTCKGCRTAQLGTGNICGNCNEVRT